MPPLVPATASPRAIPRPVRPDESAMAVDLNDRVSVGAPFHLISRDALKESINRCSPNSLITDEQLDLILEEAAKIDLMQGDRWIRCEEQEPRLVRSLLVCKDPEGKPTVFLRLCQIGEGNIGKVNLIIDLRNGQDSVVKICPFVDKDQRATIANEKRVMGEFKGCENIVQLYFTFDMENESYLVMENCNGGDLFEALYKKQFTAAQQRMIAIDIANGINILHERGFTHRDLKRENIFLIRDPIRRDWRAKVGDFGYAKQMDQDRPDFDGDCKHWSPEKCKFILKDLPGKISYKKDDIWAFGLILFSLYDAEHRFLLSNPRRENESDEDYEDRVMEGIIDYQKMHSNPKFSDISNPVVRNILEQIFNPKIRKDLTMPQILAMLQSA